MIASTVITVFAVAAVACLFRARRYRRWFRLPARRMDGLGCRCVHAAIPLLVEMNGFDLPHGLDLRERTVFLQITAKVPLLGRLRDPYIEIQGGQSTHRQYFERGVTGQRFVNLSPLFGCSDQSPLRRVGLRGSSMYWDTEAVLLVFDSPAIEGTGVLVLAPHPDDAEIAAFGMYASRRSWVATVTAGERATGHLPARVSAHTRSRWTALLRVSDSLSVPQLGQVPPERRVNLAYPDGALESMFREPSRPFPLACEESLSRTQLRSANQMPQFRGGNPGCTWNDLIEELRLLLELTRPDIIICPHPVIDTHSDHVFTTIALERAMRGLQGKRPLLFLYVVHNRGVPFYPFGPAESLVGLPPGRYTECIADSIYSHPLDPELQQTKYFAVEAMHAARRYADVEPRGTVKILKSLRQEISAYLAGISLDPTSFLRRAPRPNEIYYVVRGDMLSELVEQMFNTGIASHLR
jgi:LmbE family N-acetylglucosaminyl deacetylase